MPLNKRKNQMCKMTFFIKFKNHNDKKNMLLLPFDYFKETKGLRFCSKMF